MYTGSRSLTEFLADASTNCATITVGDIPYTRCVSKT